MSYAIGEKIFIKTADEVLDYTLKLGNLVQVPPEPLDPIASVAWSYTGGSGLIIGDGGNGAPAPVNTPTTVTVFITGGIVGVRYTVVANVTTVGDRTYQRGIYLEIVTAA